MRHCVNETVKVFEAEGPLLSELLTQAAAVAAAVEAEDNAYINVHTARDLTTLDFFVTVYVHG